MQSCKIVDCKEMLTSFFLYRKNRTLSVIFFCSRLCRKKLTIHWEACNLLLETTFLATEKPVSIEGNMRIPGTWEILSNMTIGIMASLTNPGCNHSILTWFPHWFSSHFTHSSSHSSQYVKLYTSANQLSLRSDKPHHFGQNLSLNSVKSDYVWTDCALT
jgi:hypothetical protein